MVKIGGVQGGWIVGSDMRRYGREAALDPIKPRHRSYTFQLLAFSGGSFYQQRSFLMGTR